jgi:CRP-like cAMP-binding protein
MARKNWPAAFMNAVGVERSLKVGQHLFRYGDRTAGAYQVLSGRVRLARVDSSGREAVLYVANTGDTLAEASLFSQAYRCDAIASTKSVVRFFPKSALLAEFRRDPETAEVFMAMLAEQVMGLRARLEILNIRSARERVLTYLVLNVGADGRTVSRSGTVKDLAAYLGLTHETLYRTLAQMTSDKEIRRSGTTIVLLPRRT